jgi:RHH-type proline utilization regulon transcriptional repressor/proline dehydrogenase/delta 1-pyrroline-5-carboxylate dehydrogenase
MLEYACQIENAKAVHIGVGSHNLFDIAFALILRAETQTEDYISFEMLEGMALPMQRAIKKITKTLLLYCPEAHRRDFHNAVAYLIRRLDENCGPENFLRHFYEIRPGNKSFQEEAQKFSASYRKSSSLPSEGMRRQNRRMAPAKPADETPFHNEPDTDFSLAENRKWAEEIFKEWEFKEVPRVPLMIAGEEMPGEIGEGFDPSRPATPRFLYTLADISSAQKAIDAAVTFTENWSKGVFEERFLLLGKVAQGFREQRKDLIGVMIANGGKTIWEADPEVSEAIDFIEYYRRNWKEILAMKDLTWREKGVVLVAPPWNFPCSIPVSGIAAALTAGNCVLFKPAPEAILIGWHVAKIFWDAGVPKEALQFIVCKDDPVGSYLVQHPAIAAIILTGGTATAKTFLNLRPGLDLHAEAGGKNAMIVTAMADRDLAVRDIIHSAFSHAGQKCSACSLLILEREVYDDPQFKKQLLDAAQSLVVDSAWNPHARITPLIREPEGNLLRAITQLEEGESWLLKPQIHQSNRQLLSPGIKWGVEKNSFTHLTELFGPILGVMRAASLDEAIALANATPYGLTSGFHSLDEREQLYWKERIVAGNLYINRTITGAIVRRQPFGGCKLSNFGSGAKAGGPNYVAQTAIAKQIAEPAIKGEVPSILVELLSKVSLFKLLPEEENLLKKSIENYSYWAPILKKPIDRSLLRGEDNEFYLVPRENYFLRIEEKPSTLLPLLQIIAASLICQTHLIISAPFPMEDLKQVAGISVVVEEEEQFLKRQPSRIRLLHPPSASLKQGAASVGATFQKELPLINGRIELLHYMREVSLSMDYHRYGYLGLREEI